MIGEEKLDASNPDGESRIVASEICGPVARPSMLYAFDTYEPAWEFRNKRKLTYNRTPPRGQPPRPPPPISLKFVIARLQTRFAIA